MRALMLPENLFYNATTHGQRDLEKERGFSNPRDGDRNAGKKTRTPLEIFGQEFTPETWAMANMNMIIHDVEGQIEIGDTFKNPKFRWRGRLRTFDRVVANPMWNQDGFTEADYDTAMRDSNSLKPEGKPQSVPEGQDTLSRIVDHAA